MQIIEQRANLRVKYLILLQSFTFSLIPGFCVFAHFFNLSRQNLKNRLYPIGFKFEHKVFIVFLSMMKRDIVKICFLQILFFGPIFVWSIFFLHSFRQKSFWGKYCFNHLYLVSSYSNTYSWTYLKIWG